MTLKCAVSERSVARSDFSSNSSFVFVFCFSLVSLTCLEKLLEPFRKPFVHDRKTLTNDIVTDKV